MDFTGKRVLITGSTRGIGRAAAELFVEKGARVAVNGRDAAAVERACAEIGAGSTVAAPGDLVSVAACEAMVAGAVAALGGLDVLVNNAGVYAIRSIADSDEALWDRMNDVNVKSVFFVSRAALPALRASKGNIVNVGSTAGLGGTADTTVYCATKGAVVNMTRAFAQELAPDVRVNSVCPGIVDTEMGRMNVDLIGPGATPDQLAGIYPLKRVGTAAEVAFAIAFLASEHAAFMTGHALAMDGGVLSADSA
jgi:NAD(P)-dependent dehydrogenase (short-subunit alcohol dehydrogenase family)